MRRLLDIAGTVVVGLAVAVVVVILSPFIAIYVTYTNWKEAA